MSCRTDYTLANDRTLKATCNYGTLDWVETDACVKIPTSMMNNRTEFSGNVLGDKIYVFGGEGEGQRNTMEVYDGTLWSKYLMSSPREGHASTVLGDKIMVMGGLGSGKETAALYDSTTTKWTDVKVSQGWSAYHSAAATLNDKVYVMGGLFTKRVEVYDPVGDWRSLPDMNHDHSGHAAAVLDTKIYVIGGKDTDKVEAYDPATNTWDDKANLPVKLKYHAASAMGDHIYVTGGKYGNKTSKSVYQYNHTTNTWTPVVQLQKARNRHVSLVWHNCLYVMGGYHLSTSITTNSVEKVMCL